MLSVVLLAFDSFAPAQGDAAALLRERVVRSLSSLIEGCVQGLFADASLAGPQNVGLERIADEAGCNLVEAATVRAGLAGALTAARCPDVFVLRAGYAIERGFIDEARDALGFGKPAVLRAAPHSLVTRLAPGFAEPVGLLARKEALVAAAAADLPALSRRLRCAELATRARRTR